MSPLARSREFTPVKEAEALVGPCIRSARMARELSQRELSARTGISQSTISRSESGGRMVRFAEAAAYSAALGFSLRDLADHVLGLGSHEIFDSNGHREFRSE